VHKIEVLIYKRIIENSLKFKNKICMVHGKKTMTYGEAVQSFEHISRALASLWNPGERVVVKHSDPIQQIIYLLALANAGVSSILMENDLQPEIMNNILEKVSTCNIIDDKFILPTKYENFPTVLDGDIFLGALSSGTTGQHKVIWRDHQSWTRAFPAQSKTFSISKNDNLFLSGSLVYTANLNSALHMLSEGGKVVFSETSYPRTWISEIDQNNITSIFMVPSHYRILIRNMKTPLYQIQSLVSAGEKMDKETVMTLKELFPHAKICEYYGASELGHVSYIEAEEIIKGNSVGKAFPGVRFWIEDEMIWVESPYIAPQFRPKATVGDLGRIDEEGNLYILGRKNDIINKGGIKLSPWEIEKILQQHPQISKAAVFGIKHPIKGEQVAAVIVKADPELTYEKTLAFCIKHLPQHACPQKVKFVDSIPMNNNEKSSRKALAKWFTFHADND
jgi:long-chain acyl-CoA synthetase